MERHATDDGGSGHPGAIVDPAVAAWVESFGLEFEAQGVPRQAGRMLAWLLVCQPVHQSAADLVEALRVSRGSVSGTVRLLIQLGLVERVAFPGDRRDYYRVKDGAWNHVMGPRLAGVQALHALARRGLALVADEDPRDRRRAEEMVEMYAWFEQEMAGMLERWTARQQRGGEREAGQ